MMFVQLRKMPDFAVPPPFSQLHPFTTNEPQLCCIWQGVILPLYNIHLGTDIAASIQCGDLQVNIHAGADAETIQAIVRALKSC